MAICLTAPAVAHLRLTETFAGSSASSGAAPDDERRRSLAVELAGLVLALPVGQVHAGPGLLGGRSGSDRLPPEALAVLRGDRDDVGDPRAGVPAGDWTLPVVAAPKQPGPSRVLPEPSFGKVLVPPQAVDCGSVRETAGVPAPVPSGAVATPVAASPVPATALGPVDDASALSALLRVPTAQADVPQPLLADAPAAGTAEDPVAATEDPAVQAALSTVCPTAPRA